MSPVGLSNDGLAVIDCKDSFVCSLIEMSNLPALKAEARVDFFKFDAQPNLMGQLHCQNVPLLQMA